MDENKRIARILEAHRTPAGYPYDPTSETIPGRLARIDIDEQNNQNEINRERKPQYRLEKVFSAIKKIADNLAIKSNQPEISVEASVIY